MSLDVGIAMLAVFALQFGNMRLADKMTKNIEILHKRVTELEKPESGESLLTPKEGPMSTAWKCDRCGEVTDKSPRVNVLPKQWISLKFLRANVHLCDKCVDALKGFLTYLEPEEKREG